MSSEYFHSNHSFQTLAQDELNALHKKFIKQGKLSKKDAEKYQELTNNRNLQRKFKFKYLEDTSILEGKPKNINAVKNKEYTGDYYNLDNYKSFQGTTSDGMLPNHESIDEYFTKNVSTTGKYDEIIEKWVYDAWYDDAQFYHKELQWNEKKLRKWVKKEFKTLTSKEQEEKVEKILIEWKQFKELMNDTKLKKNLKLHRTQEKLLGWINPKVGDKVTLPEYRSTSISKEGIEAYKKGRKSNWWDLTIYAPEGTNGVYISPKALSNEYNNKYIHQMEVILGPDTPMRIKKIDFEKKENILQVIK